MRFNKTIPSLFTQGQRRECHHPLILIIRVKALSLTLTLISFVTPHAKFSYAPDFSSPEICCETCDGVQVQKVWSKVKLDFQFQGRFSKSYKSFFRQRLLAFPLCSKVPQGLVKSEPWKNISTDLRTETEQRCSSGKEESCFWCIHTESANGVPSCRVVLR